MRSETSFGEDFKLTANFPSETSSPGWVGD